MRPKHSTSKLSRLAIATLCAVGVIALPSAVHAQHAAGSARATSTTAPKEAAQFDFLIGQWELTVVPKVSGLAARIHGAPRMVGTWKAWRAFDGFGIQDELRIMDGSGNPNSLSHAMRIFSATERRWVISGVDVYRARVTTASATMRGAEMMVTGSGVDAEGKAYLTRTRFHGITRDKFLFQQDRSTDNGRTWVDGVLKIEAKRTAATAPR